MAPLRHSRSTSTPQDAAIAAHATVRMIAVTSAATGITLGDLERLAPFPRPSMKGLACGAGRREWAN
jgi:hypothetical protein